MPESERRTEGIGEWLLSELWMRAIAIFVVGAIAAIGVRRFGWIVAIGALLVALGGIAWAIHAGFQPRGAPPREEAPPDTRSGESG